MRVSIITAVRNRIDTIEDAITSVKEQTYQKIEHIIQDGASTDGTLNIIQKHSGCNVQLSSEPDNGIYDAINKGIKRAQGDIIGLMHSDDFYAANDIISNVIDVFAKADIDGVYGDLQYVSAQDTTKVIRHWKSGFYNVANFKKGWMPPHPTIYLKREVFEKYGLYDTTYKISADYDAMLRYMAKGTVRMSYIPRIMVKMRNGGVSNKSLKHIILKSAEDYRALRANEVGGTMTLIRKNIMKLGQFTNKGGVLK